MGTQAALVLSISLLLGCSAFAAGNPKVPAGAKSSGGYHAVIDTDKGAITVEFFPFDSPRAVENFRLLAEHGYYDGSVFHRIVRGFMIQGGSPADGTSNPPGAEGLRTTSSRERPFTASATGAGS